MMRLHGPTKITVGDLWTLIPPSEQTLREEKRVQESVPDYTPGWLTSTVCFINSFGNHLFISLFIYLFIHLCMYLFVCLCIFIGSQLALLSFIFEISFFPLRRPFGEYYSLIIAEDRLAQLVEHHTTAWRVVLNNRQRPVSSVGRAPHYRAVFNFAPLISSTDYRGLLVVHRDGK